MIFPFYQNWQTSRLPFSLALKRTVSTGVSFDTPSGGIANRQRWARAGFQGYGPTIQYPGAGMDGLGCGCGCDGGGDGKSIPLFLGAAAAALYLIRALRERI